MVSYILDYFGSTRKEPETEPHQPYEPTPGLLRHRHELMKQIRLSKLKLRELKPIQEIQQSKKKKKKRKK